MVTITLKGQTKTSPVHTWVALTFLGPRPEGQEVRHLDGDPGNNTLGNLAYGTPSENRYDTVRHGRNKQAAQDACVQGHPFDVANTYYRPTGHRQCRACNRAAHQRYMARRLARIAEVAA